MMSDGIFETVGTLSMLFNVPPHRVRYVIRSRRVKPVARYGNAWIYGPEETDVIGRHLRAIDDVKQQRKLGEVGDDESV